ncbi:hypothetical protein DVH24_034457 [Malus domestica]|uniref:Uncharacterized protein n=1 Tax=Malus domestica TaxID=3750 RepID=A0A498IZ12_MALDO|nr:hypothetical protein DVH24_034457 [Malus domestica]
MLTVESQKSSLIQAVTKGGLDLDSKFNEGCRRMLLKIMQKAHIELCLKSEFSGKNLTFMAKVRLQRC